MSEMKKKPERGRRELLERKMFHLKRFDSAEYVLAAKSGSHDKEKYENDLEATEAYEREHDISHEHFLHHENAEKGKHPVVHTGPGSHPLQKTGTKKCTALLGQRELAQRQMFHLKRFDSAEYVLSKDLESYHHELEATEAYEREHFLTHEHFETHKTPGRTSRPKRTKHPLTTRLAAQEAFSENKSSAASDQQASSGQSTPRPRSAIVAQRFLKKRTARKRWDSADYNALVTSPGGSQRSATPDLDVMSLSSADQTDGEVKMEDSPGPFDSADKFRPNYDQYKATFSHSRIKEATLPAPPPAPSQAARGCNMEELSERSISGAIAKPPMQDLSPAAAKSLFELHQRRSRRFDSADYFRGIGPASQDCEDGPLEAPLSPRPLLGKSTLAQRQLRAEKMQRQRAQPGKQGEN